MSKYILASSASLHLTLGAFSELFSELSGQFQPVTAFVLSMVVLAAPAILAKL